MKLFGTKQEKCINLLKSLKLNTKLQKVVNCKSSLNFSKVVPRGTFQTSKSKSKSVTVGQNMNMLMAGVMARWSLVFKIMQ